MAETTKTEAPDVSLPTREQPDMEPSDREVTDMESSVGELLDWEPYKEPLDKRTITGNY